LKANFLNITFLALTKNQKAIMEITLTPQPNENPNTNPYPPLQRVVEW
jgi:hypothetical protein